MTEETNKPPRKPSGWSTARDESCIRNSPIGSPKWSSLPMASAGGFHDFISDVVGQLEDQLGDP